MYEIKIHRAACLCACAEISLFCIKFHFNELFFAPRLWAMFSLVSRSDAELAFAMRQIDFQKCNKQKTKNPIQWNERRFVFFYRFGIVAAAAVANSFCQAHFTQSSKRNRDTLNARMRHLKREIKCRSQIASVGDNSCARVVSVCLSVCGYWTFLFMKSGWMFNCLVFTQCTTIIDAISHHTHTHTRAVAHIHANTR